MPLVKHKCGKLKYILCDVFLLVLVVLIFTDRVTNAAKIETPIDTVHQPPRALRDNTDNVSSTTAPINNRYEMYNDFDKISSDAIHRIMRDENEPNTYRRDDLPLLNTQSIINKMKQITKRSIKSQKSTKPDKSDNSDKLANLEEMEKYEKISKVVNFTNSNLIEFTEKTLHTTANVTFEHVIELYINKNKNLKKFQCDAIAKLIALHTLDLSNNNLNEIIINEKLIIKKLNLTNNHIKSFNLDAIKKCPNLELLDLSNNNLSEFHLSGNSVIKVLNLSNNHLDNYTTEFNNTHLTVLCLKDNNINSMSKLNLTQLNGLESLDLSYNRLSIFRNRNQLKNLKLLDLSGNHLSGIYKDTFSNLLNMETLILLGNSIEIIDIEAFVGLPNLQYLDLSHNRIQGDSIRALQGLPDLVGLSIAFNMDLGDSSLQEFVASWSLKELDASGTGLCRIPAALAQSVRALRLVDNWFTTISCGDLDSYPLLQYLDISHSNIHEIEEDALGRLEILETLFLDHNQLRHVPISLPTSLENLFLQNNEIMEIQSQTFQGLKNLKNLDLSNNKLLYVPDLPLPKLLILNLQSSDLKGLSQLIVQTSPHLRDLLLDNNPIKCSDLLGIAEWASPCRNDRIPEPTNIKQTFLQTQEFFEHFIYSEKSYEMIQQKPNINNQIKIIKPKCADKSLTDIKRQNLKRIEAIDNLVQVSSTVIFDYNQSIKTFPTTTTTTTTTVASSTTTTATTNETTLNKISSNTDKNNDVQSTTFAIPTSIPANFGAIYGSKIITDDLHRKTTEQPTILASYQDVTLSKDSISKKAINNTTENVHSNAKLSTLSPLYNFMANMKITNPTLHEATTKTLPNRSNNIANNSNHTNSDGNRKHEKEKLEKQIQQQKKLKANLSKIKTDNNYVTTTMSSPAKSQETNNNQYHQKPTTTKGLILPDDQIKDLHVSLSAQETSSSSSTSTPSLTSTYIFTSISGNVDGEYNEDEDDNDDNDSEDLADSLPKNYEKNNSLSLDRGKQSLYKIDEILITDRHLFGTPLVVNKGHTLVAANDIERNFVAPPAVVIVNDKKSNLRTKELGTSDGIDKKLFLNTNPTIESITMSIVNTTAIDKLNNDIKSFPKKKVNEMNYSNKNHNPIIEKAGHKTEEGTHHLDNKLQINSHLETLPGVNRKDIAANFDSQKSNDKYENNSFEGSTESVGRTFGLMMQSHQNDNENLQLLGSTSSSSSLSSTSELPYGIIHKFDDNGKMTDQKGNTENVFDRDKSGKQFANAKIVKSKGQRMNPNKTHDHIHNHKPTKQQQQQHIRLNTPLDVNSNERGGLHVIQPNEFQTGTNSNKLVETLRIRSDHKHSINTPNRANQRLVAHEVDAFKENPRTTHSMVHNHLTKLSSPQPTLSLILERQNSSGSSSSSNSNSAANSHSNANATGKLESQTKPEQWLDIRSGNNHPGLFIVIGVTLSILLILGLVQVYRCRKPSLNHHRNHHYHHQNYDNHNCLDNYDSNLRRTSSYDRSLTHECEGSGSSSGQYTNCNQFNVPIPINATNNFGINNGKRLSTPLVELQTNVDDYYIEMNQEAQSTAIQSDLLPMELLCATPPTAFGTRPKFNQQQQQKPKQQQYKHKQHNTQKQLKQQQKQQFEDNHAGDGGNVQIMDRVSVVERSRFDVW